MIYILEGPDGAGKSVLANQLQQQTGFEVIHRVQPKSQEDKAKMYETYLHIPKNTILDRSWYSEMVYGPVMRDDHIISFYQMYDLERLYSSIGAVIIYCTGKPDKLWQRCLKRGEEYILAKDTFIDICKGYDKLFNVPHLLPVIKNVTT